jgi:hypothetical protein
LSAASFVLAYWTDFRVIFEGYVIDGFYWVLIEMLTALLIARKEDALSSSSFLAARQEQMRIGGASAASGKACTVALGLGRVRWRSHSQ